MSNPFTSRQTKIKKEIQELTKKQDEVMEDATFLLKLNPAEYEAYNERRRRIQSLHCELSDLESQRVTARRIQSSS
jgi:predicted nuclease with TOPRIM domain